MKLLKNLRKLLNTITTLIMFPIIPRYQPPRQSNDEEEQQQQQQQSEPPQYIPYYTPFTQYILTDNQTIDTHTYFPSMQSLNTSLPPPLPPRPTTPLPPPRAIAVEWIVVDTEGAPVQEISALAFRGDALVSVFHKFVKQTPEQLSKDWWPRRHIHGIPQDVPIRFGCDNMLREWGQWRSQFPNATVYAIGAQTESRLLDCVVVDWPLKPWASRGSDACHKVAKMFKDGSWDMMGINCPSSNHCCFEAYRPPMAIAVRPRDSWPVGHLVKMAHGHHCSLYDCVELALDISVRKFIDTYDVIINDQDKGRFTIVG